MLGTFTQPYLDDIAQITSLTPLFRLTETEGRLQLQPRSAEPIAAAPVKCDGGGDSEKSTKENGIAGVRQGKDFSHMMEFK